MIKYLTFTMHTQAIAYYIIFNIPYHHIIIFCGMLGPCAQTEPGPSRTHLKVFERNLSTYSVLGSCSVHMGSDRITITNFTSPSPHHTAVTKIGIRDNIPNTGRY